MFTPTPFLQNAIHKAMTPCPFKIIQTAIATHMVFVQENENDDIFNAGDIEAHRNLLIMWCLAVGQESNPETRFSLIPDDNDLKKHKINPHRKYIQPTLKAAAASPVDPAKTVDATWSHHGAFKQSSRGTKRNPTRAACLPKGEGQQEEK
jgi:hypothetical protein